MTTEAVPLTKLQKFTGVPKEGLCGYRFSINLAQGEYTVTANDKDGNIGTSEPVTILSGVSFAAILQPTITTNYTVSGCHDGKRGDIPNGSVKSNAIANASNIKKQTSAKTMPPSSTGCPLSDEQITLITCWVDDGAPDN